LNDINHGKNIYIIFDTRNVKSYCGRFIISCSKSNRKVYIIFNGNTGSEIGEVWHLTSIEMRMVIII